MFNDVCIFHRAVDEVPRADLGATEQEVAEPLLVLVPVQSCFAVLKWNALEAFHFLYLTAHSLTHHGHFVVNNLFSGRHVYLIISFYEMSSFLRFPQNLLARCTTRKPRNVLHPLVHAFMVFHAQEAHEEVLQLFLIDDAIVVLVDQLKKYVRDGPDPLDLLVPGQTSSFQSR